ncbi:MAG: aminotransferase class IV [Bacteroidota bacterium]
MSLLVETIRINDGIPVNLEYHNQRMHRSLSGLFSIKKEINLESVIKVPVISSTGVVKCRIEYDRTIGKIEFQPYYIRPVRSLRLVEDNEIEYRYKFADRSRFDALFDSRGDCDDILIVKNGLVTDTYYANCIFKSADGSWVTPGSCLLKGTRRSSLLDRGLIREGKVMVTDIKNYVEVRRINAMIDIDDSESIPIENIR